MKVIILGAGEVGKGLAATLCLENNDVIMVDRDEKLLEDLSDTLDIMTYAGNGAWPSTLQAIDVQSAQLLVAVTDSTEVNILACQVAKKLNPDIRTVSRVSSPRFFPEDVEFDSRALGIDHTVIPQVECTQAVLEVVKRPSLKEMVHLSTPGAVITGFQINPGSPMVGCQLFNFPRKDLLEKVRVCAIWRRGRLIIPRGKERFNNYDEIYIAGDRQYTDQMIEWATIEEHKVEHAVIAGASGLGLSIAEALHNEGTKVTIIEPDLKLANTALDTMENNITVIHGDSTESDVLQEAGTDKCDAFISSLPLDENNVLSSLMAKRLGAGKVIAIINKPDYREIISSMDAIDCCFSPRIAALNSIINLVKGSDRRIGALLHRISAEIFDMTVIPKCRIADKAIRESTCPEDAVFAMILRGNVIIPAVGNEVFQVGDRVVMMGTANAMRKSESLFSKKYFFG
ncbi:MAG: Trk system potassium transporter TrkA [Lentisphaeraceae bacterium]|nr:Trk system potassium transporter TrkA [Lentisphaeraceae bacterium]